jgi:argininosuccinate lyase
MARGMSRLWDKGTSVNELALAFTVGDDHVIDTRLIPFDCEGSAAHARVLEAAGLLTKDERAKIDAAISDIRRRAEAGELKVSLQQEDSHTLIEQELSRMLGPVGAKIHAGRSRNDQAATMLRLALRHGLAATVERTRALCEALLALAARYPASPMPGYTHLQRAMPSSVAAWALGYAEVLCERAELALGLRRHLGRSPLGSAAGYGVPMKLDRKLAAKELGFAHPQAVTAVQLTRGLDELAVASAMQQTGIVVSRMAADLVLFATREFGMAKLPAELTTGSSIMPQKQNPDLFELMRARGAALGGHVAAISAVLAGLPGGYQRDLQIIKKSVMSALDETHMLLDASALAVRGVQFDEAACLRAMSPELYATAAAYRLVRQGLPFRDAYRQAAADKASWELIQHEVMRGGAGDSPSCESGADAADSHEYTSRLVAELTARVAALGASQ